MWRGGHWTWLSLKLVDWSQAAGQLDWNVMLNNQKGL
jgi:hypothetical protein